MMAVNTAKNFLKMFEFSSCLTSTGVVVVFEVVCGDNKITIELVSQ